MDREKKFLDSLTAWETSAEVYNERAELVRVNHAQAYRASEGKTADLKKADADIATSEERILRNAAEVERDANYHTMIFYRGSAGEKAEAI